MTERDCLRELQRTNVLLREEAEAMKRRLARVRRYRDMWAGNGDAPMQASNVVACLNDALDENSSCVGQ